MRMIKENTRTSILLLMPLKIEYDAVRKHLQNIKEIFVGGVRYETGTYRGMYQRFNIVIVQAGVTNTKMGLATEKAIQYFQPATIFVVGIAGGVKDVEKGDVVVATKVYGYESGKETSEGYVSRPDVVNFDQALLSVALSVASKPTWKRKLSTIGKPPKVVFGAVASGDKVITSKASSVYQKINRHFNDTLALEMEAIGFGKAVLPHPHIRALVIRSISDLLDHKDVADDAGFQHIAAEHAAAFLFGILDELELNKIKIGIPDNKAFIKEVLYCILPIIEWKDINDMANEEVARGILNQKLKEIVADVYDELSEGNYSEISEMELRYIIKKLLERSELIRNELLELMMKIGEGKELAGSHLKIVGNKNVIGDNNIQGESDFLYGRIH